MVTFLVAFFGNGFTDPRKNQEHYFPTLCFISSLNVSPLTLFSLHLREHGLHFGRRGVHDGVEVRRRGQIVRVELSRQDRRYVDGSLKPGRNWLLLFLLEKVVVGIFIPPTVAVDLSGDPLPRPVFSPTTEKNIFQLRLRRGRSRLRLRLRLSPLEVGYRLVISLSSE